MYELLADLRSAYASRCEYFLGAVVTTKETDGPGVPFQVRFAAGSGYPWSFVRVEMLLCLQAACSGVGGA